MGNEATSCRRRRKEKERELEREETSFYLKGYGNEDRMAVSCSDLSQPTVLPSYLYIQPPYPRLMPLPVNLLFLHQTDETWENFQSASAHWHSVSFLSVHPPLPTLPLSFFFTSPTVSICSHSLPATDTLSSLEAWSFGDFFAVSVRVRYLGCLIYERCLFALGTLPGVTNSLTHCPSKRQGNKSSIIQSAAISSNLLGQHKDQSMMRYQFVHNSIIPHQWNGFTEWKLRSWLDSFWFL